jgi:pyridoxine 5-phosphate synthase
MTLSPMRLGVNLDHIATLRQARGTAYPDPVQASTLAMMGGADQITVHLREDRRHIQDRDVYLLKQILEIPLNLEMAATDEMIGIALEVKPHIVTLVPEKREELTTEGGLDVIGQFELLQTAIQRLKNADIKVSLFVEAQEKHLEASKALHADTVELHTGTYCDAPAAQQPAELLRLQHAATFAHNLGLEVVAGHGLHLRNVGPIAAIPEIVELNIGHAIIAHASFVGLQQAVKEMAAGMKTSREALNKS